MLMTSLIILSNTGRRFGNNSSTGTTSPSRLDVLKFQSQMVASASWASRLYWIDLYSRPRSEEHTSELQSRPHLVCRLLLEKKKRLDACLSTEGLYCSR